MKERWWLSNFGTSDVIGGTEKSASKYCKILNLKYMSARKFGIDVSNMSNWDISKEIDDIIKTIEFEMLMYNSINCWSNKPRADKSLCICNENFKREAESMKFDFAFKDYKLRESSYQVKSLSNADKILTVSKWEQENLKEDFGFDSSVLESSTNTDIMYPIEKKTARNSFGLPLNKKIFLFVGRRHNRKGYDIVLDLARNHPEYLFVNVVDSSFKPTLNIKEFSDLSDEEMNILYNSADYLLAPSRYESFGLMFIEALATNLPIIGSRVGIAYDISEEYGLFTDDVRVESFERLLNASNTRTFSSGRKMAEDRFSFDVMAKRLKELAR